MGSCSDDVADEEDRDDGRRHKDAGGDEGAGRQSRESADTVTRRAAIAPDRPEADEEARSIWSLSESGGGFEWLYQWGEEEGLPMPEVSQAIDGLVYREGNN